MTEDGAGSSRRMIALPYGHEAGDLTRRCVFGVAPVEIGPATDDVLPRIVEILNYTAANLIAG